MLGVHLRGGVTSSLFVSPPTMNRMRNLSFSTICLLGRARLWLALMWCLPHKTFPPHTPFSPIYISSRIPSPQLVLFLVDPLFHPSSALSSLSPLKLSRVTPEDAPIRHLCCLEFCDLLFHKQTIFAAATIIAIPAALASLFFVPLLHIRPHGHKTAHATPCPPRATFPTAAAFRG